ncbi:unnamed protein product [Prorocentrum cordatum]|uniref:RNase H type-1 domain-containing protein n=1 Tax=Prorocentrum cordatum TaxID=2364126 RepID=A0ABN9U8N6_9DINO|nr:unnamed protein product [Polarella glacialis]
MPVTCGRSPTLAEHGVGQGICGPVRPACKTISVTPNMCSTGASFPFSAPPSHGNLISGLGNQRHSATPPPDLSNQRSVHGLSCYGRSPRALPRFCRAHFRALIYFLACAPSTVPAFRECLPHVRVAGRRGCCQSGRNAGSAFANRQWPQARLCRAGLASTANCRPCVRAGLCDPQIADPSFTGHLAHRILTCPATAPHRRRMAPAWIQDLVRQHTDPEGVLSLSSAYLDLLTRGIAPSPASAVDPPPEQETFEWVVPPGPLAAQVNAYVDGSRLDGEADLHDLCARQGWAIAAYDGSWQLVAAAHGRTPPRAVGIHATELWGLLMAVRSCDPAASLKVDCSAVQLGAQRDLRWATAPCRILARAWGPISVALESNPDWVMWMPAHNAATS